MRPIVMLFVAVLAPCAGCSMRAPVPSIEVRDAWARPADSAATTAAYFTVLNHEKATVTLQSESSPFAGSVSLHESMEMDGMAHMMPVTAPVAIAAADSLVLKAGARHLMVMELTRRLTAGDSLPLLLRFTDGRDVRAVAIVRAP